MLILSPRPAAADILVNISKSSQRMSVLVDGTARYNWSVSTGARRYTTPSGVYQPQWLARKWRSRQYGNAPMPHSIFFHRGYAIHGTTEVKRLGKAASHGCVRLHPQNAAILYALVQKQMAQTRLVVSDEPLEAPGRAPERTPSHLVSENDLAPAAPPPAGGSAFASVAISAPEPARAETAHAAPRQPQTRATDKPRALRMSHASRPGFDW
jgi:hypothetical protein